MNKIKLLLLLCLGIFYSCESILDKQPLDSISDSFVWSDEILIDDYLNQCYSEMNFYFETDHGIDYGNHSTQNRMFQQLYIADEGNNAGNSRMKSNQITINGGICEWWGYNTVRKLNVFLEKITDSDLAESYKIQRKAEARFLRAFAYFNMVKRYGGVPLITQSQQLNDPKEEIFRARDKEMDVYNFILDELDSITNDLPEAYEDSDLGRPTKYASLALKSRVAMYAGSIATWGSVQLDGLVGIPQDKAAKYWEDSYNASKEIIESGKFSLYNRYPDDKVKNFRNLFLDEGNSEVIFSERFDGLSGYGHSFDMYQVPRGYHVWGVGQQNQIYLEMVESFDNIDGTSGIIDRNKITKSTSKNDLLAGYSWTVDELFGKKDPRFKASIYTQGTLWTWKNGPVELDYHLGIMQDGGWYTTVKTVKKVLPKGINNTLSCFGCLKYLDEKKAIEHERYYSDVDYIVFRLGEIFLNYAEASIELNRNDDALMAINKIRERAGMPLLDSINRDLVRKERKVEMAFEGTRYFDLRRWRTAVRELNDSFNGLQLVLDATSFEEDEYKPSTAKYKLIIIPNIDGIPNPYFDQRHYYLPIGSSRTGANPNLVENPGYR